MDTIHKCAQENAQFAELTKEVKVTGASDIASLEGEEIRKKGMKKMQSDFDLPFFHTGMTKWLW